MSKRFLFICTLWTGLTLLGGLIGVWRIHTHPVPEVPSELRASKLGLGIGALTATGYAAFWLLFALTARKRTPHLDPGDSKLSQHGDDERSTADPRAPSGGQASQNQFRR